jgi:hypothetical protein
VACIGGRVGRGCGVAEDSTQRKPELPSGGHAKYQQVAARRAALRAACRTTIWEWREALKSIAALIATLMAASCEIARRARGSAQLGMQHPRFDASRSRASTRHHCSARWLSRAFEQAAMSGSEAGPGLYLDIEVPGQAESSLQLDIEVC